VARRAVIRKGFFFVIRDTDNWQYSIDGPMNDDSAWVKAVDDANKSGPA